MARKVLIDCDPGIDDAVAICLALFDPRLEVVAITSTAGNVDAAQSARNVQTIVEQLDPQRWPRLGVAPESDLPPVADFRHIHGQDGLGNAGLVGSELHNLRPAEKIIADAIRDSPNELTLIGLGPLTNFARTFQRDPELATLVNRLVMVSGSALGQGDITACAEFNMYSDPESARAIFRSRTTKTLIPLEVSQQVQFSLSFLAELPPETSRAGGLLRKIIPHLFRAYRQELGLEGIYLPAVLGILGVVQPEIFEMEELTGDVETGGEICRGCTVFDRRPRSQGQSNMEVAVNIDATVAVHSIVRGLKFAGQNS